MEHSSYKLCARNGVAGGGPSPHGSWYCSWRIFQESSRLLDEALKPLGLASKDFWLLVIAGASDLSQHEMAELCGLHPTR